MTTAKLLASYNNGNVSVLLFSDGTKVRSYASDPLPVHPESIDLKITDWCDAGCVYCHEQSTIKGQHASVRSILEIVSSLPRGVEIAIGGGDPFSHPAIEIILSEFAQLGLISNVTVNGRHIERHSELIRSLRNKSLLYGLGVSFHEGMNLNLVANDNTIVHFIAGENKPAQAMKLMRYHPKILVLGYKRFGRGIKHHSDVTEKRLAEWRYWIGRIMRSGSVCFDNLALEQLNVKRWLDEDMWDRCFMGNDGKFTMYVDAVRDEFAISSTSN